MKFIGMMLLLVGVSSLAFGNGEVVAPEVSAASATGALALLSGALLVVRGRRKK